MSNPDPGYQRNYGNFDVNFVSASRLQDDHFIKSRCLLAAVHYGEGDEQPLSVPCPLVFVPTPQLNEESLVEVWISSVPVTTGQRDGVRYAVNGQVLFGVCEVPEPAGTLLDSLTYDLYKRMIQFVNQEGYPDLLRVWNYLSDINEEQNGLERYRRFCQGRYDAFSEFTPDFERILPAGAAVGTLKPGLLVYFVATRGAGQPIENPRQTNPYRYPPQYSPRSPSFCRAMFKDWRTYRQLFLSGTASIVEHETRHAGDVRAQLNETLHNMQALLEHAANVAGTDFRAKSTEAVLKAYVRRASDLPLIRDHLVQALGEKLSVIFLNADLCRRELLVEVEGIYKQ